MNVDDELTLCTIDPWAQKQELELRKVLYRWKHIRTDRIVSDYLSCPLVIHNSGVGLTHEADIVRTDPKSSVVSRQFHPVITEPADIEKIKMPTITYDEEATEEEFARMSEVFGDIMPVKKEGFKSSFSGPWDRLIRWWGVEEALTDLVMRPQMVNDAMSRLTDARLSELEQLEKLNLLALNDDNGPVGSGAYGYTSDLPGEDFDPDHVRLRDMWGHSTAQIFSAVSPEMHWEFALRHEMRVLERWGLTNYGCCEPLDGKMEICRRIPNLRKVSMSPWIDVDRAVSEVRDDYVFSYKTNPAILAEDTWRPDAARREIAEVLDAGKGCHIEIIMKDISTVRYHPQRLWEWSELAMELVQEVAG